MKLIEKNQTHMAKRQIFLRIVIKTSKKRVKTSEQTGLRRLTLSVDYLPLSINAAICSAAFSSACSVPPAKIVPPEDLPFTEN